MGGWRIGVVLVGLSGGVAGGQTFVTYSMHGVNLSGRPVNNPDPGDVIRMSLVVEHDGHSYAGGRVEMRYSQAADEDFTISEPEVVIIPPDVLSWEDLGRHPFTRIAASDGPADAVQPHNEDVVARGGRVRDVDNELFDFASIPPGLGGLAGPFPITSGDSIFNFDYVYRSGQQIWDTRTDGTAILWRSDSDASGIDVQARNGDRFIVGPPAPGTLGPLLLAGVAAHGRRRAKQVARGGGR